MADITACKGGHCPVKELCYRYYCNKGQVQSYFTEIPYTYIDGVFKCKEICSLEAEKMAENLNSKVNGNNNLSTYFE